MKSPNPYYAPESLDLEQVLEVEYSDLNWQYDTRVIWRHKGTGKLYTARDEGCSCPTPFEDYTSLDKLYPFNADALLAEIRAEAQDKYSNLTADKAAAAMDKIRSLAREVKA